MVVHVHNLGGAPIENVTTLGNVVLRIEEQGRILSDTPSTAIPFAQNSIAPGATRDVQNGTANDLSSPSRIFVEFITSDGQTAVLGYAP